MIGHTLETVHVTMERRRLEQQRTEYLPVVLPFFALPVERQTCAMRLNISIEFGDEWTKLEAWRINEPIRFKDRLERPDGTMDSDKASDFNPTIANII